ncbi:MAG TPA: hypothetical protein VL972_07250, partial [Solirubrobacteraceae bacterium]|nr:hypothetical protein [Solirubrobacteraceae bacterium]
MQGQNGSLSIVLRVRLAALAAVAALVCIAALAPSAAHAASCEDSWAKAEAGSWNVAANWSKKAVPVAGEEVCITAAGTYTVLLDEVNPSIKSLTLGGSSGTQTLAVDSTCSNSGETLTTTAGLNVEAHGALTLGNADSCAYNVYLKSAVTNLGSITAEKANGGQRQFQGNLTNEGTLHIETPASGTPAAFNGAKAALTNEGAIDLSAGSELLASDESTITDAAGGSIAAESGAYVFMQGGTFTQGAGKTSGEPVYVESGAIVYTGSGASTIATRGASTLSGNISAGQKLELQSTCSQSSEQLSVAASLSSAGTITMENSGSCGYNTDLSIAEGQTLTSTGTISAEVDAGGKRQIQGNLVNGGALDVNQTVEFDGKAPSLLTNEGTIDLATGERLYIYNGSSLTNAAGTIASTGTGQVYEEGATLTQGAGKTSGEPVYLDGGSLVYTGSGASTIAVR